MSHGGWNAVWMKAADWVRAIGLTVRGSWSDRRMPLPGASRPAPDPAAGFAPRNVSALEGGVPAPPPLATAGLARPSRASPFDLQGVVEWYAWFSGQPAEASAVQGAIPGFPAFVRQTVEPESGGQRVRFFGPDGEAASLLVLPSEEGQVIHDLLGGAQYEVRETQTLVAADLATEDGQPGEDCDRAREPLTAPDADAIPPYFQVRGASRARTAGAG